MKHTVILIFLLFGISLSFASVPQQINYQGKVEVNGIPFDGVGHFKFAIVDTTGTITLWSNDGTSVGGSEPTGSVSINVKGGLYNVRLGDISYGNMTRSITADVFSEPGRFLRIWFNGGSGFQKLTPDQSFLTVPYAMMAQTVPDNSITGEKLTRESVWPEHEGRGNTVVSYFATYMNDSPVSLGTVPAGKTFVITDIIISSGKLTNPSWNPDCMIDAKLWWQKQSLNDVFAIIQSVGMRHINLKAGIPIGENAEIFVNSYIQTLEPKAIVISGYEFSN